MPIYGNPSTEELKKICQKGGPIQIKTGRDNTRPVDNVSKQSSGIKYVTENAEVSSNGIVKSKFAKENSGKV